MITNNNEIQFDGFFKGIKSKGMICAYFFLTKIPNLLLNNQAFSVQYLNTIVLFFHSGLVNRTIYFHVF